ncbi:MAG: dipeptide epimerase [Proteobacteria bacterium]|nr:dipeptide epimerase [Pseudomonadota bacterium]
MQGEVRHERWKLAQPFVIAHETYLNADVVVATLRQGNRVGRGECTPTEFYGETIESTLAAARDLVARWAAGEAWECIHDDTPAGAARNAVDCAVWDLRAKRAGKRAWELAGIPAPRAVRTATTISVGDAQHQAAQAQAMAIEAHGTPLIKLKLDAEDVATRVAAVRAAAPGATLIVDANASWDAALLAALMPALRAANVAMIEQPLPAGADAALAAIERLVPVCADESAHVGADLDALRGRYDLINVKLDKTGGLTEALRMAVRARELGFDLMVGCMEGTSLAMAPAMLIAGFARFVDLDGPLLIGRDREHGLSYERGIVAPPSVALWG